MDFCCGFFPKTFKQYQWFSMDTEDGKVLLMPCFDNKIRVNYCPSCGAYVREVEVKETDMKKILNNED